MGEKDVDAFKRECRAYLSKFNLNILRSYGRMLQLRTPTKMRKQELITGIIGILCGEYSEQRNGKKGAPVKGECVTQEFLDDIDALQRIYFNGEAREIVEVPPPADPFTMQYTVELSQLSAKQKKLLMAFLKSL